MKVTITAGYICLMAAFLTPLNAKARFVSLKGTVQVFVGGKWQTATTATQLESGTPIQTAYNSNALIMFSSGGQMALKPNTKIILNDLPVNPGSSRDIFLEHGQVSAFVNVHGLLKLPPAEARRRWRDGVLYFAQVGVVG